MQRLPPCRHDQLRTLRSPVEAACKGRNRDQRSSISEHRRADGTLEIVRTVRSITVRLLKWDRLPALPACRTENDRLEAYPTLPGSTNVVNAELIGVAWPLWGCLETARSKPAGRRCVATKLMIQRVHQILTDAPRQCLSHMRCRWYNERRWLPIG